MKVVGNEYRSHRHLKLGEDIKKIATDTQENKEKLEQYFIVHNLVCEVLLFSQLSDK